ncbi:MAG: radical SAM protein [Phycisphaerae bacterium]|nr:radical SAM protein [Phycisphaerae bacterium]
MAHQKSPRRPDTAGEKSTAGIGLPVMGQGSSSRGAAKPAARKSAKAPKPPVVSFVSLGCAKNLVDSEKMLGQLAESGAIISGDESLADTVVVNTCGFLESSRIEALDIIHELGARKAAGKLKRIVVAGCLVQRDGEKLRDDAPEIDALVGVNNRDDIVRAVWRMDRDEAISLYMGEYHGQPWQDRGRLRLTPRHYAYLRISEGCNQKCTFCTIPSIRGPMHSKTPDELVGEATELTADGVREVILIGQDTTSYGLDLEATRGQSDETQATKQRSDEATEEGAKGQRGGRGTARSGGDDAPDAESSNSLFAIRNSLLPVAYLKGGLIPSSGALSLSGLLRRLDRELVDARWIRLMYVYPSVLTDDIIDAIAESSRVAKYIDIPLQHINDRMLKRMARRVTRRETETLLNKLRQRIPGVTIRTTFIVGFPGETEAEFNEILDFVHDFGFEAAGAFKYSLEPDTPAGRLPDQLEDAVKQERYERFMLAQQEIALAAAKRRVGQTFDVLLDRAIAPAEATQIQDAIEVDAAAAGVPAGRRNAGPAAIRRGRGGTTGWALGRHAGQAPDVDSVCIVQPATSESDSRGGKTPSGGKTMNGGKPSGSAPAKLLSGEFVRVRCIGTAGYDLVCQPV